MKAPDDDQWGGCDSTPESSAAISSPDDPPTVVSRGVKGVLSAGSSTAVAQQKEALASAAEDGASPAIEHQQQDVESPLPPPVKEWQEEQDERKADTRRKERNAPDVADGDTLLDSSAVVVAERSRGEPSDPTTEEDGAVRPFDDLQRLSSPALVPSDEAQLDGSGGLSDGDAYSCRGAVPSSLAVLDDGVGGEEPGLSDVGFGDFKQQSGGEAAFPHQLVTAPSDSELGNQGDDARAKPGPSTAKADDTNGKGGHREIENATGIDATAGGDRPLPTTFAISTEKLYASAATIAVTAELASREAEESNVGHHDDQKHDQSALSGGTSWASSAYGIWRRDGEDVSPSVTTTLPVADTATKCAEKADSDEWVDVAADDVESVGGDGWEAGASQEPAAVSPSETQRGKQDVFETVPADEPARCAPDGEGGEVKVETGQSLLAAETGEGEREGGREVEVETKEAGGLAGDADGAGATGPAVDGAGGDDGEMVDVGAKEEDRTAIESVEKEDDDAADVEVARSSGSMTPSLVATMASTPAHDLQDDLSTLGGTKADDVGQLDTAGAGAAGGAAAGIKDDDEDTDWGDFESAINRSGAADPADAKDETSTAEVAVEIVAGAGAGAAAEAEEAGESGTVETATIEPGNESEREIEGVGLRTEDEEHGQEQDEEEKKDERGVVNSLWESRGEWSAFEAPLPAAAPPSPSAETRQALMSAPLRGKVSTELLSQPAAAGDGDGDADDDDDAAGDDNEDDAAAVPMGQGGEENQEGHDEAVLPLATSSSVRRDLADEVRDQPEADHPDSTAEGSLGAEVPESGNTNEDEWGAFEQVSAAVPPPPDTSEILSQGSSPNEQGDGGGLSESTPGIANSSGGANDGGGTDDRDDDDDVGDGDSDDDGDDDDDTDDDEGWGSFTEMPPSFKVVRVTSAVALDGPKEAGDSAMDGVPPAAVTHKDPEDSDSDDDDDDDGKVGPVEESLEDEEGPEIHKEDEEKEQQEGEEEDEETEWSDFGDFEEAPTPVEAEDGKKEATAPTARFSASPMSSEAAVGPASAASSPTRPVVSTTTANTTAPDAGAYPSAPGAVPRSSIPASGSKGGDSTSATGEAVGSSSWNAFDDGGGSAAAAGTPVAIEGTGGTEQKTAALPSAADARALTVAVAVFDRIFGGMRNAATLSGHSNVDDKERALASMVDMTQLMRHAQQPRHRPARLGRWARSCILSGIPPVPDALDVEDSDEESREVTTSRGSGVERPAEGLSSVTHVATDSPSLNNSPRAIGSIQSPLHPPSQAAITFPMPAPSSAPPPLPVTPTSKARTTTSATRAEAEEQRGLPADRNMKAGQSGMGQEANFAASFSSVVEEREPPPAAAAAARVVAAPPTFDEATPEMPRHAPPRIPSSPPYDGLRDGRQDIREGSRGSDEGDRLSDSIGKSSGWGDNVDSSSVGGDDSRDDVPAAAVESAGVTAGGSQETEEQEKEGEEMGADGDDWGDDGDGDPFDDFQSAPSAVSVSPPPAQPPPARPIDLAPDAPADGTAAGASATPAPASRTAPSEDRKPALPSTEEPAWNLDFFMSATSSSSSNAVGRSTRSGVISAEMPLGGGSFAGGAAGGGGKALGEARKAQAGAPVDLISQALADFGIANSPKRGPTFPDQAPPSSQEKVNTSFFGGFAGADSVTLPMPSVMAAAAVTMSSESGSIGGVFDGKGTRERIGSVEVADLLRATRLRGGGVGGPRQKLRSYQPQPERISDAAQARLAALPDLSFMLSNRLCFPVRAGLLSPEATSSSR